MHHDFSCTGPETDIDGSCSQEELAKANEMCNLINTLPAFETCRRVELVFLFPVSKFLDLYFIFE